MRNNASSSYLNKCFLLFRYSKLGYIHKAKQKIIENINTIKKPDNEFSTFENTVFIEIKAELKNTSIINKDFNK